MPFSGLPEHPTWGMLLLSLAAPVLTVVAAYVKLRQGGINQYNIAEIKDRAQFRKHMMERLEIVEEREQSLLSQMQEMIRRHEGRERQLLTEIATLHLKIEDLEEELERTQKVAKLEIATVEIKADRALSTAQDVRTQVEMKGEQNG